MSLAGLLNKTFTLYRKTTGITYPPVDTWASQGSIPCYVSQKTVDTILDDQSHVYIIETRFRTEPYTWAKGDRIYYNSHMYETLSYENFDELGMEAVTIGKLLDESVIADMGL